MGCRATSSVIASITTTISSTSTSSSSSIACSVTAPHHLFRLLSCRRSKSNDRYLCAVLLIVSAIFSELFSPAVALPLSNAPSYTRYVERERASPSGRKANQVVRHYKLHNRCSGHHVAIVGRHVDALASIKNQNARLRFETVSFGSRVRIQSDISREFLCFNKRAQLIIRRSGVSSRCEFSEVPAANGFTEFRSAANDSWFVGFGRNGRRLPGFIPVVSSAQHLHDYGGEWQQQQQQHRRQQRNNEHPRSSMRAVADKDRHAVNRSSASATSDVVISSRVRSSISTAAAAVEKAAALRRCYQFTKTDFPYIDDQVVDTDDDDNDDEDITITGEDSSSEAVVKNGDVQRRPADKSSTSTRGDAAQRSKGGRSDDRQPWAPRIDYREWFARQIMNSRKTNSDGDRNVHGRHHDNENRQRQQQQQARTS